MSARARIQASLDEAKAEVTHLARVLKDIENQIADRHQRIAPLSAKLDDATKRRDATDEALTLARDQSDLDDQVLHDLPNLLVDVPKSAAPMLEVKKQVSNLRTTLEKENGDIKEIERQLNDVKSSLRVLEAQQASVKDRLTANEHAVSEIQQKLDSLDKLSH